MKVDIKVSVIVPVYNTALYLNQCLDSIINQTLKEIEIICVDDESTDESLSILEKIAEKDERIIVLQKQHGNAGDARNLGLSVASGEYLSFLDSDDFFEKTMLFDAYSAASKNKLDMVIFRAKRYFEENNEYREIHWTVKGSHFPKKTFFSPKEIKCEFFFSFMGYAWDKIFSRRMIEENKISFQSIPAFNDAYFTYIAAIVSTKIAFLDKVLVYQRKRKDKSSITDLRTTQWDCSYKMLNKLKEKLVEIDLYLLYKQDFINYATHLLIVDSENKEKYALDRFLYHLKTNWMYCFELNQYLYEKNYISNKKNKDLMTEMIGNSLSSPVDDVNNEIHSKIYISYAFDEGYARYTLTSIESALKTKKPDSEYIIYLLVPQKFDIKEEKNFCQIEKLYENCLIKFIRCGECFDDVQMRISHITSPTYYRLLLPQLFPDHSRILYLDGDTVVCDDLSELFFTELETNLIAGVPALSYYRNIPFHSERLNLKSNFQYINAGVILFDLERLRDIKWSEKCIELLDQNYRDQDQDIINVTCQGKIKLIDRKFNVQSKYFHWSAEQFKEAGITYYDENRAYDQAVILHYADKIKPWNDISSPFARIWWKHTLSSIGWSLYAHDKVEYLISISYSGNKNLSNRTKKNNTESMLFLKNDINFVKKIKKAILCLQENGIRYTITRIKQKIKNKLRR